MLVLSERAHQGRVMSPVTLLARDKGQEPLSPQEDKAERLESMGTVRPGDPSQSALQPPCVTLCRDQSLNPGSPGPVGHWQSLLRLLHRPLLRPFAHLHLLSHSLSRSLTHSLSCSLTRGSPASQQGPGPALKCWERSGKPDWTRTAAPGRRLQPPFCCLLEECCCSPSMQCTWLN